MLVFLDKIKGALMIYSAFFGFIFVAALYLMIMVDQVAMIFNLFGFSIYAIFVCLLISIIFSIRAIKIKKINQKSDVQISTVEDDRKDNLDD